MPDNTPKKTKTNTPTKGFLRIKKVAERLQIGVSTIWQRIALEEFPQPVKIGKRTTVFFEDEIDAYMESFRKTGAAASSTSLKSHPGFTVEKPPEHLKVSGVQGIFVYKRNPVIHNIDKSLPPLEDQMQLYK